MRSVTVAVLLLASSARAQSPTLQAVGSVGTGYTDNVASASDAPGVPPPQSDSFTELRPGLILSYASDRTLQRLSYEFFGSLYYTHSEANSYSNRLGWQITTQPDARSTVTAAVGVSSGRTNTLQLLNSPAGNMVGALPPGGNSFVSTDAREAFTYDLSPVWRAVQSLTVNAFIPIDVIAQQANSDATDVRGGVERTFANDAVSLQLRTGWTHTGEVTNGMAVAPGVDQVILGGFARWRHDLSPFWTAEVDAGLAMAADASKFSNRDTEPTALAALRWRRNFGQAELSYLHDAQTNVLVGETFFVDQASLRASVPFGQTGIALSTGGGYQHGRGAALAGGMSINTIDVWLADGALAWSAPTGVMQLGARYQYFKQTTDVEMASVAPQHLSRTVVMFVVGVAWPQRNAALPEPGEPTRVDRADQPLLEEKRPTETPPP